MDRSFREQGSGAQQDPKRFLVSPTVFASLIQWLAGLIKLTEEEQEAAGIYLDRLSGRQINIGSPAYTAYTAYTIHKPQIAVMISQ